MKLQALQNYLLLYSQFVAHVQVLFRALCLTKHQLLTCPSPTPHCTVSCSVTACPRAGLPHQHCHPCFLRVRPPHQRCHPSCACVCRSYSLPVKDGAGRTWEFVIKSWANGTENRRVYVLEQTGEYLKVSHPLPPPAYCLHHPCACVMWWRCTVVARTPR